MTAREVGKDRGDVGAMRKIRMVANGGHGSSGCPGPPNEDKEGAANNKTLQPSVMSPEAKDSFSAALITSQPSSPLKLSGTADAKPVGGSTNTITANTSADTTPAGTVPNLKSSPAPPSPTPSPTPRPPPPPVPFQRKPKLLPTLSPLLQTSDKTVAGSSHFLPSTPPRRPAPSPTPLCSKPTPPP